MVERSELRTDHGDTRTICLESEDPARVIDALRELGLHSHRNVSVPRELKAMAGIGARRYAVIDVGTNSVKFRIEERAADGSWRSIVDRAEVTRLGEDLHATGRLGDDAIARTTAAVTGMITEAGREHVEAIAAIGTAGLRIAPNRSALIDAVREQTGVEVEVITGEDEARLAYAGAISELDAGDGSLVVFDTGGGSSQFTIGHWDRVDESFSLNVGAVRLTERYGLDGIVDDATLASALDAIAVDLARLDGRPVPESVVGMGGAVTNLAAVKHGLATYDRDVVHGSDPRPCRDRSANRALPPPRWRRAPAHHRPPAQSRRGHPRRRLHRPHRPCQARSRVAHRQRPRAATRPARRALQVRSRTESVGPRLTCVWRRTSPCRCTARSA